MQLHNSYRKCLVCNKIATDLKKTKCECGAYMYMIGVVYSPKTRYDQKVSEAQKKIAPEV